jgi:hypothetical protein
MQTAAEEALRRCELDISRIKCIIPHQANQRIIDAVGERLGAKPEQLFVNLHKYGNTSAASVPIALRDSVEAYVSCLSGAILKDEYLRLIEEAGFVDVRGESLALDMTFSGFDDYWQPLLAAGQTFGKYFGALPAAAQSRTHDAVRAAFLVGDDDGPRSFAARAFAVSGRVPGSR